LHGLTQDGAYRVHVGLCDFNKNAWDVICLTVNYSLFPFYVSKDVDHVYFILVLAGLFFLQIETWLGISVSTMLWRKPMIQLVKNYSAIFSLNLVYSGN
jgi:hypothetical protein